jgi:hypothetical protein
VLARSFGVLLALSAFAGGAGEARAQAVSAGGQPSGQGPDAGAAAPPPAAPMADETPEEVRWHGSSLLLYQRVGTTTVGVGADYQSHNPFYDINLYFRPRYYMWERKPSSVSLRGQFIGSVELTNSDSTTREREVLLEDSMVSLVWDHTFGHTSDHPLLISLSAPRIVVPTSKASSRVGKIMDLGARVIVDQTIPLRKDSDWFPTGRLATRLGYQYSFVHGTTPEATEIDRVRMDLDGTLVRNNQVSGAAFAEHSAVLRGIVGAEILRDILSFAVEIGADPTYKRKLPDSVVCSPDTGCYTPLSVRNPQRFVVVNYFDAAITAAMFDKVLELSVGYENVTAQNAGDGQHRNIGYSPDAKFYLVAELHLDTLYGAVRQDQPKKNLSVARSEF